MDNNFGEGVESMGWLVGVVSWRRVWLECIGVVSGCCCMEVYRYRHNNYYFSLLHLY